MSFKINKLISSGKTFDISRNMSEQQNTYTILTGKNGTGKTNILTKAVNSFIFENKSDDVVLDLLSDKKPRSVIAITTARFDRFPAMDRISQSERPTASFYKHLGINGLQSNSSIGMCNDIIKRIVSRASQGWEHKSGLGDIFNFLGYSPEMKIQLRLDNSASNPIIREFELIASNINYEKKSPYPYRARSQYLQRKIDEWSQLSGKEVPFDINDKIHSIYARRDLISKNEMTLTFHENIKINFTHSISEIETISLLLFIGIIRIKDVYLSNKENYLKKQKIQQLSSGQLCLILSMSFLASSLTDNALVCIDEPENSLHPEWQSMFIQLLQILASNYRGCHFMIATHSPQIVSGVYDRFAFINDLEINKLQFASEFMNRSADYQLSELFNAPGYRNEYLIRVSLVILSKISKSEALSEEDLSNITHIKNLADNEKITKSDPVYHLINQITMMM